MLIGYIALHRKTLDSSIFDNPHLFKMWAWCLLKATHTEHKQMVGLEEITLNKGQFVTGRFVGAKELKVNESTWYKHLKQLEKMQMISINSNNKYTVVTVVNWCLYQVDESKSNNKRTTKEQQKNTNNNGNNENKKDIYTLIINYLNLKTKKAFKDDAKKTIDFIDKRLSEDFTLEDFKKVIDNKTSQWLNTDMQKFLRPETLFGNKFEGYLNEKTEDKPEILTTYKTKGSEEIVW